MMRNADSRSSWTQSAENTATWNSGPVDSAQSIRTGLLSSAHVTYDGLAGSASTIPPATRPAICSDFGPRTPASTGGTIDGGWSSCTSSRSTWRPCIVTFSPASSRRTATIVSSSVASGEGVRAPICSIHDCTPWPMPGRNRPGASSHRVAISIAVIAGFRATAGMMPIPTVSRSVVASAVAARLTPAV